MKKLLGVSALFAIGLGLSGVANAASMPDAASVASSATAQTEKVDFRAFRHCHGPRWDRRCHGGVFRFGYERRDRDDYRYRYHRDRYDRYDRGDRY